MRDPRALQLLAGLVAVMLGTSGPLLAAAAGRRGARDRGSEQGQHRGGGGGGGGRGRAASPSPSPSSSPRETGDPEEAEERLPSCRDPGTGQARNQTTLNSFLWRVTRDPPSYLFGTIHVPYTSVWEYIPENSKDAFYQSEYIVFELDLMDPFTISALNNCQLLPNGEYLSNVIPRDLYERLKSHLEYVKVSMPNWMTKDQKGRGLYADYLFNAITGNWERKRPVYVMLMINALTETDIKSRGTPVLDLYLAQEALKMHKRTAAVEEVQEHCVPLNDMNVSQVLFALNHTLWLQETQRRGTSVSPTPSATDLIGHYNCGDLNAVLFDLDAARVPNLQMSMTMPTDDFDTAQDIEEYFREELIHKRNERMAQRIAQLMVEHPRKSFFFAFGAGHFLGNASVIERLQNRGYEIQHTPPNLSLPGTYRKRKRQHSSSSTSTDSELPPLIINGNLDYLDPFYDRRRNRHRHDRGRKRGRQRKVSTQGETTQSHVLKQPEFNELWVKIDAIDATSFGSSSYLRQELSSTHQPPVRVYATYNASPPPHTVTLNTLLAVLLLVIVVMTTATH